MKRITGDLLALALAGEFDVIIHGCNCFHTMGAGIAKPIAKLFPEALAADKATEYGAKDKLGTISHTQIERDEIRFTVVNAYTQHQWRGRGRKLDYDALQSCFETVAARYPDARIGYPMIGAGLAGGDWVTISGLIDTTLAGFDHTLVVLP